MYKKTPSWGLKQLDSLLSGCAGPNHNKNCVFMICESGFMSDIRPLKWRWFCQELHFKSELELIDSQPSIVTTQNNIRQWPRVTPQELFLWERSFWYKTQIFCFTCFLLYLFAPPVRGGVCYFYVSLKTYLIQKNNYNNNNV